ncbi:hypothetical protein Rvan_1870 [Rhodomicrobium vannielii ATCC 17100]|uniref:Zeta toxin domain-containing protein n=1 Tax=Rhodomicrobium vannielii (strain ATCC 17100 / DSM 162 / LMG 4299 / NCIMB 10020 / ATH 3.1.1) TaxID=648757 RepID=E3I076_RHOVT|nr:zeta toxin family protein [Rhodomicrobium vannielii]ADP71111.1 hypothetical protein Rvan_1870 [Rhodomicrobium vannielii ATCC 17100]
MNSRSYKLSPEIHNEIFETVKHNTLANAQAAAKPVLAIIGAQPGAMRWRISAALIEGMDPDPVIFSVAGARHLHPLADEILAENEKSFVQATEADAEKWTESLILAAVSCRRNILLDGFLGRKDATLNVLRQAREADYDTRVVAIAVPESISRARIVDLYEAGKEKRGSGTWISAHAHDGAVQTLVHTLTAIEVRNLATIDVFDRDGALLLSTEERRDAGGAFRREMARPLDAIDKERLKTIQLRIDAKMEARQAGILEKLEAQTVIHSGRSTGLER